MGRPAGAGLRITREARAKINPFLRVVGSRGDGFHDIETVILPTTLFDLIAVRDAEGIWLSVGGSHAEGVPEDETNLAHVAADLLFQRCPETAGRGAVIEIVKRIPVAAGLGGGSADAAATLLALNDLWRCRLPDDDLFDIAAAVGSDVPALLVGGPVAVRGRGEVVAPVAAKELCWVVLPLGFPVKAADAYARWDAEAPLAGGDVGVALEALRDGEPADVAGLLFNDLQEPVESQHREVSKARELLLDAGALAALMSGSGPTVVGLADGPGHARVIASRVDGSLVVSTAAGGEG